MDTMTLQINNPGTVGLLYKLQEMNLVTILDDYAKPRFHHTQTKEQGYALEESFNKLEKRLSDFYGVDMTID